jgi:TolB protein
MTNHQPPTTNYQSLAVLCALLLMLVGCQPLTNPPSAPGTVPRNTATTAPAQNGRLAYIGGDGNVYVTEASLSNTRAVTADATTNPEGNGRSYHRIAWSRDGRLAFAAVERGLQSVRSQLYAAVPGEPARLLGEHDEHFVIYIHWSPRGCVERNGCGQLAYLIEEMDDIGLRLVELTVGDTQNNLLGLGQPFYFSWSPDGEQMVWHTGGARRYQPEARLALHDLDSGAQQTISRMPGLFQAPAWSPTGAGWLDVVERTGDNSGDNSPEHRTSVRRADFALRRTMPNASGFAKDVVTTVPHDVAFVWSPDGTRIAHAARRNGDDPALGPIHVADLTTGETRRITDVGLQISAFFWSPDGQRLAYLHRLALPDAAWSQWRVYDLKSKQDRGFAAFNPSFQMRTMMGSFNQYAQSHRFWSPDGRYLVFADRSPDLTERVWLVDTHAPKGTEPIFVSEGTIGVWSWR